MGDFKKKESFAEKVNNRDKATASGNGRKAARSLAGTVGKTKMISAKVNPDTYRLFTTINKKMGVSNNSRLNELITRFVIEHKDDFEGL